MESMTLEQFVLQEEHKFPHTSGRFTSVMNTLALTGKIISREVSKAGLIDILGLTGAKNIQGEEVKKLDEYANDLLKNMLRRSKAVSAVASEEDDTFTAFPEVTSGYLVVFDPLDGSSNIDVNAPLGTIFGIYKHDSQNEVAEEDFHREGKELVAAGYLIYGSGTMFVYSTGDGVNGFTLDPSIGEFLLSHPSMHMPTTGSTYSLNEGKSALWGTGLTNYLVHTKSSLGKKSYSSRYIGTFVADFHRILLQGGIFVYPQDEKNPQGKLRLLYECAPLGYLAEQAGGKASTGNVPITSIRAQSLHQRVPLYIGSKDNVEEIEKFLTDASTE